MRTLQASDGSECEKMRRRGSIVKSRVEAYAEVMMESAVKLWMTHCSMQTDEGSRSNSKTCIMKVEGCWDKHV